MIGRRGFLALAGALACAARGAALAQTAPPVRRVGFLEAGAASANRHFVDAFRRGMHELGYDEGRNLVIDVEWAEGRADRFPVLLEALLRRHPDVIVVASTLGAVAARNVVKSVPVVFVGVSDPKQMGLVASLARPGGNMTGISRVFGEGLIGKALQILTAIAPGVERVAILFNAAGEVEVRVTEAQAGARSLGLVPIPVTVREQGDFKRAFAAMRSERADALMVVTDPLTLRHRDMVVGLANANRIPAVYEFAEFARAGGLVAYSANIAALFARAAVYVDKILAGANPGELPIEQPNKFELVINLRTARELKLSVPQSLLLQADEVIS